jgi:uncharacterized protein
MNSAPLILYHTNCADGFCAAWVAHNYFGEDAEYKPVQYGEPAPDIDNREVFILDFSYKRPIMNAMVGKARTIVVCDHHKTAAAELSPEGGEFYSTNSANINTITRNRGGVYCVFDMEKSGGRLTWDFFYPNQPRPWLVDYTEDRDLWRWKLDWSKEISAFIASYPHDFKLWDDWSLVGPGCGAWDMRVDAGSAILRYQSQLVDSLCATAREVDIDGHKVLACNTSCLFSEVAGKLAKNRPFGAAWFIRSDGKKQWSLRSREDGVDVSEVAKNHGGGGHRAAAGFEE